MLLLVLSYYTFSYAEESITTYDYGEELKPIDKINLKPSAGMISREVQGGKCGVLAYVGGEKESDTHTHYTY